MSGIDLDLVGETLASVRLRMGALATFHLTAPWGVDVPALGPAFFYAVMEGAAVVEPPGAEPIEVLAGDVFLMPSGDPVQLRSARGVRAAPLEEVFDTGQDLWAPGKRVHRPISAHFGGGGQPTRILVMLMEFAEPRRNALGLTLPSLILLRRQDNRIAPWLGAAANSIIDEASEGQVGYWAMATRLAELLFVNAIRAHFVLNPSAAADGLRGAADPRIARALAAFYRQPGENWTIERLAAAAGMSRSAFAERFQQLIGKTPHIYVSEWRMRLARDWIAQGRRSVKAAALELGYASERTFSQAFRRVIGALPSRFQRRP